MALPWGAPLTVEDVWDLPDDGHRHELIDGVLLMTPAPGSDHQVCVVRLATLLDAAAGSDDMVLIAPFDWLAGSSTLLQPDVLVARRIDIAATGGKRLERPPRLVVEVHSPSTRKVDLGTKRLAFEAAGVPTYWLVDPVEPRLTVLRLVDGRYVEEASVAGAEAYTTTDPFALSEVPADLLRGR